MQKVVCAELYFVQAVFHTRRIILAAFHDFQHSHDGIHRRPDFMAHIGKEIGFGPIGLPGSQGGFLQAFLVEDGLGDILKIEHILPEAGDGNPCFYGETDKNFS